MELPQSIKNQFAASQIRRAQCREAGTSWPPKPWQRVEATSNRNNSDLPGRQLGTVLNRDGSYTLVLLDDEPPLGNTREYYWDNELRPVLDDTAQGWVPYRIWAGCPALQLAVTTTYDVQLENGTWVFECFAKPQPAGGYQFQEIGKPYRRFWHHQVVKLRPSEQ